MDYLSWICNFCSANTFKFGNNSAGIIMSHYMCRTNSDIISAMNFYIFIKINRKFLSNFS